MRAKILLFAAFLAACSSFSLAPHKIEIQQGNYVTQDMVSKLKPGMTRSQVRFILGSPLIADAFHGSRWDYVYRLEKDGKLAEERKLAVYFEDDKLKRIEGDVVPAKSATTESPAPGAAKP